jgi:hypothetical protein
MRRLLRGAEGGPTVVALRWGWSEILRPDGVSTGARGHRCTTFETLLVAGG